MKSRWVTIVVTGILLVILATASSAQQQQKQSASSGKSPMPAATYDFWKGEQSILNPVKNSLDSELTAVCQRFAASDASGRADIRSSISKDESYTLLTFSNRSAVFAIRERSVNWVRNGLIAIAMLQVGRTDFRDILMAASLVYHSAKRVGTDPDQLFRDVAKLSEPDVSTLLTQFTKRSEKDKDLRSSWGYDEVETKDGIGFIGWEFADYRPSYDLKKIIIDIADVIARDKYQPEGVSVAGQLPPVWLSPKLNPSAELTLKKARGGASVFAKMRPNEHSTYESQILMVFLVEVGDERVAQELLDMSRKKGSTGFSTSGMAIGRLFCLVVGESFVQGVNSFETPESMARFEKGITEVLRRYSK